MDGYYDTMQVCSKCGNVITDSFVNRKEERQRFCNECGGKTIIECENCRESIKGLFYEDNVAHMRISMPPYNCHKCGKSYPWRKRLVAKDYFSKAVSPFKYIVDSLVSIFKR